MPLEPKYRRVLEKLSRDIVSGRYKLGQKLPSEASLVRQFGVSRITVGRAVRELKERGLIDRIAGSGTYVRARRPGEPGATFGLLIPDLGTTEIFEPICQGMAAAPEAGRHALLWGRSGLDPAKKAEEALRLCHEYVSRNVSGVFFAPLEFIPSAGETNHAISAAFDKARIPLVLLDRDFLPFPNRSAHDLIGIDNRRAGYLATEHLIKAGCRRIVFVGYTHGAATVQARIAGFREAMFTFEIPIKVSSVQSWKEVSESDLTRFMKSAAPEAFVCANDRTAGDLMYGLIKLQYKIPSDVRIVGIDDVSYAKLLPVPLTTIRQPCREIGEVAMATMCNRLEEPTLPTREILLDCKVVVRESSG